MDPEIDENATESRAQTADAASVAVAGICGSLVPGGTTRKAVAVALRGASELGVTTKLIDLRDYELVFCGQVAEADYPEAAWQSTAFSWR